MNIEYEQYPEEREQLLIRAYINLGLPLNAASDAAAADLAENLEGAGC